MKPKTKKRKHTLANGNCRGGTYAVHCGHDEYVLLCAKHRREWERGPT